MNWKEILSSIDADKSEWVLVPADLRKIANKMRKGELLTAAEIIQIQDRWQSKHPFADDSGNPFVLFIYDRYSLWDIVSSFLTYSKYKFHFMWCSTLQEMEQQGRGSRYKAKYDIQNPIFNSSNDTPQKLDVCKNCLKQFPDEFARDLDRNIYKNLDREFVRNLDSKFVRQFFYSIARNVGEFNMKEFFDTYGMQNLKKPTHQNHTHRYLSDWFNISWKYKATQNWICEKCDRDFLKHKEFLHTHHKNRVKDDNDYANLAALCCECHGKQPGHSYMGTVPSFIKRVKKQPTKQPTDNGMGKSSPVVLESAQSIEEQPKNGVYDEKLPSKNSPTQSSEPSSGGIPKRDKNIVGPLHRIISAWKGLFK